MHEATEYIILKVKEKTCVLDKDIKYALHLQKEPEEDMESYQGTTFGRKGTLR